MENHNDLSAERGGGSLERVVRPTNMRSALLKTHDETQCSGEHCCIHNPSDHHMRTWPLNWRDDKGVMERICPHGVGHPDPDDAAHNVRIGREWLTVHGCDGCCRPNAGTQRPGDAEATNATRATPPGSLK